MKQCKTMDADLVLMVSGDNFTPVNSKTNPRAIMDWDLDRAVSDHHYGGINRRDFRVQVLRGISPT